MSCEVVFEDGKPAGARGEEEAGSLMLDHVAADWQSLCLWVLGTRW
jgi:hypothetical protein